MCPPQARWTPWSTGTRSKLGMTVVIGRNAPPDVIVRETWAVGAKGASQRLGAGLAVKRRYGENPLMNLLRQNTGTIQRVPTALAKIGVNI
jgi:hypothetical protein